MTVNRRVAGSSPAGGAKQNPGITAPAARFRGFLSHNHKIQIRLLERFGALRSIRNAPKTPRLLVAIVGLALALCSCAPTPPEDLAGRFLLNVRPMLSPDGIGKMTDSELVEMGRGVCVQLDGGKTLDDVMFPIRIANTTALAAEIGAVIGAGVSTFCPRVTK